MNITGLTREESLALFTSYTSTVKEVVQNDAVISRLGELTAHDLFSLYDSAFLLDETESGVAIPPSEIGSRAVGIRPVSVCNTARILSHIDAVLKRDISDYTVEGDVLYSAFYDISVDADDMRRDIDAYVPPTWGEMKVAYTSMRAAYATDLLGDEVFGISRAVQTISTRLFESSYGVVPMASTGVHEGLHGIDMERDGAMYGSVKYSVPTEFSAYRGAAKVDDAYGLKNTVAQSIAHFSNGYSPGDQSSPFSQFVTDEYFRNGWA